MTRRPDWTMIVDLARSDLWRSMMATCTSSCSQFNYFPVVRTAERDKNGLELLGIWCCSYSLELDAPAVLTSSTTASSINTRLQTSYKASSSAATAKLRWTARAPSSYAAPSAQCQQIHRAQKTAFVWWSSPIAGLVCWTTRIRKYVRKRAL